MLSFFPRDVLVEILDLIESVCEGLPTYSPILQKFWFSIFMPNGYLIQNYIRFVHFCIINLTSINLPIFTFMLLDIIGVLSE